jgi:hypothetical protein
MVIANSPNGQEANEIAEKNLRRSAGSRYWKKVHGGRVTADATSAKAATFRRHEA